MPSRAGSWSGIAGPPVLEGVSLTGMGKTILASPQAVAWGEAGKS
ncbi:hypothetical protein BrevBR_10225 [Brevundimonas sp. BR2-1]